MTGSAKLIPYGDTGNNLSPAWAADGQEIAFIADSFLGRGSARVVVLPMDGRRAREYRFPEGVLYPLVNLRWMPDGSGLSLTAASRQGRRVLVRLRLPEEEWEISPLPENFRDYSFEWGPDSGRFFYAWISDDMKASRLVEHVLETGEDRVLYAVEEGGLRGTRLSPDGRTLAFYHDGGIWLFSLETAAARRVAPEWNVDRRPTWSPDGRYLSFVGSQGEGGFAICILELATGTVRQLELDASQLFSRTMGSITRKANFYGTFWSPATDEIAFIIQAIESKRMIMADPLETLEGGTTSAPGR